MRSAGVVIANEISHNLIQVLPVKDYQMVKAFSAESANDAFAIWILPWASCSCRSIFQSKLFDLLLEHITIDAIVVTNDIFCCFVKSKSFSQLLRSPEYIWPSGYINMEDYSSMV